MRAKRPKRLPVVLTKEEVDQVIGQLSGTHRLMAQLLYGSGLRLMECVRLRVKDLDFAQQQTCAEPGRSIIIRDAKGGKDRLTVLPESLALPLQRRLQRTKLLHEQDLEDGYGCVYLPYAFHVKAPNACREWIWQYVFPSSRLSIDPRSGKKRRHHIHENNLQKAVKKATQLAGIDKRVTCHTLRQGTR